MNDTVKHVGGVLRVDGQAVQGVTSGVLDGEAYLEADWFKALSTSEKRACRAQQLRKQNNRVLYKGVTGINDIG